MTGLVARGAAAGLEGRFEACEAPGLRLRGTGTLSAAGAVLGLIGGGIPVLFLSARRWRGTVSRCHKNYERMLDPRSGWVKPNMNRSGLNEMLRKTVIQSVNS